MNYEIGQVVYITDKDSGMIVPLMVIEEVTKKRWMGDHEFIYNVQTPTGEILNLNQVKSRIYTDLDEIRLELETRALKTIQAMVNQARQTATERFKHTDTNTINPTEEAISSEENG